MELTVEYLTMCLLLDYIERLRANEVPEGEFLEELDYPLYLVLREVALSRQDCEMHVIIRRPVNRWAVNHDGFRDLINIWFLIGWVEKSAYGSFLQAGSINVLAERYRAYPPGAKREMSDEERESWLAVLRADMNKNGEIKRASRYPREIVYRLVEAGVAHRNRKSGGLVVYHHYR